MEFHAGFAKKRPFIEKNMYVGMNRNFSAGFKGSEFFREFRILQTNFDAGSRKIDAFRTYFKTFHTFRIYFENFDALRPFLDRVFDITTPKYKSKTRLRMGQTRPARFLSD